MVGSLVSIFQMVRTLSILPSITHLEGLRDEGVKDSIYRPDVRTSWDRGQGMTDVVSIFFIPEVSSSSCVRPASSLTNQVWWLPTPSEGRNSGFGHLERLLIHEQLCLVA